MCVVHGIVPFCKHTCTFKIVSVIIFPVISCSFTSCGCCAGNKRKVPPKLHDRDEVFRAAAESDKGTRLFYIVLKFYF